MPSTFTGKEFAKHLSAGTLKQQIVKFGMVKKHDEDATAIWFSEGTACGSWLSIPVEAIEEVTLVSHVKCRDHEHPLVRIVFKEPPADDKVGRALAELARQSGTPPVSVLSGAPGGASGAIAQRRAGGSGLGLGLGAGPSLTCIAWHQECRWVTLYIPSLNLNVPVYVCYDVCDTFEP